MAETALATLADELSDSVDRLLAKRFPQGPDTDAAEWSAEHLTSFIAEVDDAGWSMLLASADDGGLDAGAGEIRALFRMAGTYLVPLPLRDLVITGPLLRRAAGASVPSGLVVWSTTDTLVIDGARVSGVLEFVNAADVAAGVAFHDAERNAVLIVPADSTGVTIQRQNTIDLCERPCTVTFDGAEAEVVLDGDAGQVWLARHNGLRRLSIAAEASGVARTCVDAAGEYAKQRMQFGRAIGSFQALSHVIAEMYCDAYALDALSEWAASFDDDADGAIAARAQEANAFAADMVMRVVNAGLQVHGAIGYTDELSYNHFYKRAMTLASLEGTRDAAYLEIGRIAVAGRTHA